MTRYIAAFALLVASTQAFAPSARTAVSTQSMMLPDSHSVFDDNDKYTIKAVTQPTRRLGGGSFIPPPDVYGSNDPAYASTERAEKKPIKQVKPGLNSERGQMTQC